MLVLNRKEGSRTKIGDAVVTVLKVNGRWVSIGIDAPPEVKITREEAKKKLPARTDAAG